MWKIAFSLFILPGILRAQQTEPEQQFISFKPKLGFLAAHRGTMGHLPKAPAIAGELSFGRRVCGSKKWNSEYRFPYMGITLFGASVGNDAVLGHAFGTYGFIEFPVSIRKWHTLTLKVGAGLGYVTKVFDQELNPKDVAISTHINALINLGVQGRIRLTEKQAILYGIDLTHLSNGSYKVPNLGLNMPFLSLGYSVNVRSKERKLCMPDTIPVERKPFFKNWKLNLIGIVSLKETFPTGNRKYPVYAASIIGRRIFRPRVGMEVALDLMSKQALFAYKPFVSKTQWDIFQVGVYAGYVLPLDHLHFVIGMGYYVKDHFDADNELYHRVGMRYHFDNGITANMVLKAHWAKADYVEWGIGYTFKYNKR